MALPAGVHAIAHADQAHAGESEALHCLRALDAVAGETGQVIDQDHVEPAGSGDQAQVARAIVAGPAHGGVSEFLRCWPALARGVGAAVAQLVLEACFPLLV